MSKPRRGFGETSLTHDGRTSGRKTSLAHAPFVDWRTRNRSSQVEKRRVRVFGG